MAKNTLPFILRTQIKNTMLMYTYHNDYLFFSTLSEWWCQMLVNISRNLDSTCKRECPQIRTLGKVVWFVNSQTHGILSDYSNLFPQEKTYDLTNTSTGMSIIAWLCNGLDCIQPNCSSAGKTSWNLSL